MTIRVTAHVLANRFDDRAHASRYIQSARRILDLLRARAWGSARQDEMMGPEAVVYVATEHVAALSDSLHHRGFYVDASPDERQAGATVLRIGWPSAASYVQR